MRNLRCFWFACVGNVGGCLLLACSGFGAGDSGSLPRADEPPVDRAAVPAPPSVGGKPTSRIAVHGTVAAPATLGFAPIPASVKVTLVDALGVFREGVTNVEGRFSFVDVEPPYDIGVFPIGSDTGFTPRLLLGGSSVSPTVRIQTAYKEPPTSLATTAMTLNFPTCPEAEGCFLHVSSGSSHGSGYSGLPYLTGTVTSTVSHVHIFNHGGAPEEVTTHIFAATKSGSMSWYSKLSATLSGGGAQSFTASLLPLPARGRLTATIVDGAYRQGSPVSIHIMVLLPGAPEPLYLASRRDVTSVAVTVPDLPGAQLQVRAERFIGQAAAAVNEPYCFLRSWSEELPLSAREVELRLPPQPESLQPGVGGTLHAKTGQISWSSSIEHTAFLALDQDAGGFEVVTNENSVAVERLYKLGVPELRAGTHSLTLFAIPRSEVSDATGRDSKSRLRFTTSTENYFSVIP